jgi:hypothetical protein
MNYTQMTPEPFIGPRPFERSNRDQIRFFGRDEEVEEIVSLIVSHRVVLIYGSSGSGKTSIFNAQVIPTLEQYGFTILPMTRLKILSSTISDQSSSNNTEYHSDITNIYIFNALVGLKSDIDPKLLKKKSLPEFLKEYFPIKKDNKSNNIPQILIFDQFEELFTFYPNDKWREQQKDFFQQVAKALYDIPSLEIVFVIREDYLAYLDPFLELLPEGLRPRFRLERLQKDSALLAIKGPLENVPKDIIQNYKGDIDYDINNIIHELLKSKIEYRPGKTQAFEGEFIEPILLQKVLMMWWRLITNPNSKLVISVVDTALEELYEDAINYVINKGKIKESELRRWCEEKLITSLGTKNMVHRSLDTTEGIKNDVIDILENIYFIKGFRHAGAQWYELSHDLLIQAITSSNQKWKNKGKNKIKLGFHK